MAGAVVLVATHMVLVSRTLKPENFIVVMASMAVIAESLRRASKVTDACRNPTPRRHVFSRHWICRLRRAADASGGQQLAGSVAKARALQSRIEFQGVTFSYPEAPAPALCKVDLVVPQGQSVAIVGRNGSGKTTLLALLPRFYDPQSGRITIDGHDIAGATLRSLRSQISVVTQDSVVFPGTIAQNIAYGNRLAGPDAPIHRHGGR